MAKVIRCQCGFLGRGETADEAATVIEAHMREDHPELVGKVTRKDLIADGRRGIAAARSGGGAQKGGQHAANTAGASDT